MEIRKVIISATALLVLFTSIILKAEDHLTTSSLHSNKSTDELTDTGELIIGFTSESEQKSMDSPNVKAILKGKVLTVDGVTLELNRVIDVNTIIEKEQQLFKQQNVNQPLPSDEALFLSAFNSMSPQEKALISIYKTLPPKGVGQSDIIDSLKNNPDVEFVEPNYIYKTNSAPEDPLYPEQWAHQLTNAEAGWDITRGEASVVVAVIDSGVDYRHEDLATNIWHDLSGNPGIDFVDIDLKAYESSGYGAISGEDYTLVDTDPMDVSGHGTHCAGIVAAASNLKGVIGIAPDVKVMPIRAGFALSYDNKEIGVLENDAIIKGIFYAVINDASIISMSFSGPSSIATKKALELADSFDVVLVAGAGNTGNDRPGYPAGYETTIAVSSVGSTSERAYYSSFGYWVDVAAPGGDIRVGTGILSTVPSRINTSGYEYLQGTSMSGPYIAGVAALVRSNNKSLNASQVRVILRNGVNEVNGPVYIGTGIVDVEKALRLKEPPIFEAEITNPEYNSLKRVEKNAIDPRIAISGTASGDSYKLYYGSGFYPQSWNQFASGGTVNSGHLGGIDIALLAEADYMLKLVVTKGEFTKTAYSYFSVQKGVQHGWNTDFLDSLYTQGQAPLVVDIDNDGDNEVLAYDQVGKVYLFNHDGSVYTPDFPVNLDADSTSQEYHRIYVSAGNVVGDALNEIVVADYSQNELSMLSSQGKILIRKVSPSIVGFPTLADNDNDGLDEIHFLTVENGNFTVNIANENLETVASWTLENRRFGIDLYEPMPVDLDNDSIYEVMTVSTSRSSYRTSYLEAWTSSGVLLWSVEFSSYIKPVFGDIDSDGYIDIAVLEETDTGSRLHVLDKSGEATNKNFPIDYQLDYEGAIILADMNKDNSPEIILTEIAEITGNTYIIDKEGKLLDRVEFNIPDGMSIYTNEILASDIDGDNEVELIYNTVRNFSSKPASLLAYNQDGTVVDGFPRRVYSEGTPVIASTADVDNDGDIEILTGGSRGFTILDLDGTHHPERDEWITHHGDAKRSRTYFKESE